jgi:membrane-bound lytic murein transglycosylase MltF
MPPTWAEICRALGWRNVSPFSAPHNIFAGVYYQARMDRIWARQRTIAERHALGLASYNAGPGSILKAQALCAGARLWEDVAPCLPLVTGAAAAKQTVEYGPRIARWHRLMQ